MSRVIQLRVRGAGVEQREGLHGRFAQLVAGRDWRGGRPWLADRVSRELLAQLFFEQAEAETRDSTGVQRLSAAAFVRIVGDEADALAAVFIARDLSERFAVDIEIRDPDNPIAKLRRVELSQGRLPNGDTLESILVRRVIYKRLPDGSRMEMTPPHGRNSVFGRPMGDAGRRQWSFVVHDIRVADQSFLDGEAEAMRIFRGLRALPAADSG